MAHADLAPSAEQRTAETSQEECLHGMAPEGCGLCAAHTAASSLGPSSPSTSRSKQYLLNDLCDLLGVARYSATPGSSPARVFDAAAARADVAPGSMPTVGAAIARKAGLVWGPECDNRHRHHDATMVTREGVAVLMQAMSILTQAVPTKAPGRRTRSAAGAEPARKPTTSTPR